MKQEPSYPISFPSAFSMSLVNDITDYLSYKSLTPIFKLCFILSVTKSHGSSQTQTPLKPLHLIEGYTPSILIENVSHISEGM